MSGLMIGRSALRRAAPLLAACAFGLGMATAIAQQVQDIPKTPANSPPKAATGEESNWVRICTKDAQGGADAEQVCLVRYEGLEPKTGAILITAAVRTVEGANKQYLLVNVPTAYSLAIPAGAQIKIDESEPVQLHYAVCLPPSCQVQTELSKEMLGRLRKGQKMFVAVNDAQGKTRVFPIPLTGFSKTADGPPVDNRAYQAARSQMIQAAHERQRELAKEAAGARQ